MLYRVKSFSTLKRCFCLVSLFWM